MQGGGAGRLGGVEVQEVVEYSGRLEGDQVAPDVCPGSGPRRRPRPDHAVSGTVVEALFLAIP
ncbi:hypothetical protein [Streptomyces avermitilis]|uniref:hypothetical protein n=1 Tax=Streptomyces avermitilis TaxID=33903 RepID=UPI003680C97A